ncbi:nuclear transport factor 2 family protein [Shinella sp.]|uniref:nuclear transport factor 2 family protein n=1 Tax=Shinella sp. TaxID=1870904 RepID=UPI003F729D75
MSQDQAREAVEAFFRAFNAGDGSAMAALVTDDVAHDLGSGQEIGRDALRSNLAQLRSAHAEEAGDVEIMINASGSRAAAEFTLRGTGGERAYSIAAGAFFDLDGGRVSRVTVYRAPA